MSSGVKNSRPKALCIGNPKWVGEKYLQDFCHDYDFHVLDVSNRKEWIEHATKKVQQDGPFTALMIRMGTMPYEPFDEAFFEPLLPDLRIVVSASAGYNEFPVTWLTSRNVWFCNTVDAVAESTADMAMFFTLAALRDTTRAERSAREGKWRADHVPSRDPSGLTLGIVGMGAIGKHLARKAKVFNLDIQYHNRHRLPAADEATYDATYCETLEALLETSDVVSLSVPLTSSTKGMMSTEQFNRMKDSSVFINTARGAIVDDEALIQALESGKVWRAGLDVFSDEPNIPSYYKESENVTIQPHLGGLTVTSFKKAEMECFENIKAFFRTGEPIAPVNEVRSN